MYVSEIQFHVSPSEFDQVYRLAAEIVERLRQVPGCRQVLVVRTAGDRVTSYAIYDSYAQAEGAMPLIADFFAKVAPYLTVLPQRQIHPALVFEQFSTEP